jgi:DNA-directed RNA polymerase subunit RPC12/RpoP
MADFPLHSWRRGINDKWYCLDPRKFLKLRLDEIEGKLAKCPTCSSEFVIDSSRIKEETAYLECPGCTTNEWELTKERQIEILRATANAELATWFEMQRIELTKSLETARQERENLREVAETLLAQKKEIKLQRQELEIEREAFKKWERKVTELNAASRKRIAEYVKTKRAAWQTRYRELDDKWRRRFGEKAKEKRIEKAAKVLAEDVEDTKSLELAIQELMRKAGNL